jgi:hypothetical protein
MIHNKILRPLEKAFRIYAVLILILVIFQLVGLLMYIINVWPHLSTTPSSGVPMSGTRTFIVCLAVVAGFFRSFLWVCIYWNGARVFSLLTTKNELQGMVERITPLLASLTRLLIASCIMDVLFLPAYFLSDVLVPFSISGWRLGAVEVARIVFPQAFGFAALILAFLTSQYSQLLKERSQMKKEIELTI